MKRQFRILGLTLVGVVMLCQISAAQQKSDYQQVFAEVQRGLVSGSIETFSRFFGSQVSINLRGGENGLFSSNQAFYLLQSYFRTRKLTNLAFTTMGNAEAAPFATGSASLSHRGTRDLAQVYVALKPSGERWVISQINIY